MVAAGYHDVPRGHIAAVVTYLEMYKPPPSRDAPCPDGVTVRHVERPALAEYRRLFRAIGEPWLWFSRLVIPEQELAAIIQNPSVDIYFLEHNAVPQGLLEINRCEFPDIELSFFGLTPSMIGKGAGRFFIQYAIQAAFAHHPRRFWLHTCSLDHPKALGFYCKAGFTAYKRCLEVAPDPRLTGKLPRTAAPQIPIIE